MWVLCLLFSGCADCGSGGGKQGAFRQDDEEDAGAGCGSFAFSCHGTVAVSCAPDASSAGVDCARENKTCDPELGCVACQPGETTCADGHATWCDRAGTLRTFECDPAQGMTCKSDGCEGACTLDQVSGSYIGCDYYPTMTLNPVWSGFAFAVAVSNASDEPAQVTLTGPNDFSQKKTVAAQTLATFELPWVNELKGDDLDCTKPPPVGATRIAKGGAYRVRADHPITVYQFSPLQYQLDPAPADCPLLSECSTSMESRCLSYSNDASILLPATALTGNYAALSWPTQVDGAGFLAITATEDDTEVITHGAGAFAAGAGIDAAGNGKVMLQRGDVLELVAGSDGDPSGTRVRADKPVQVVSGHSCAYVPTADVLTCDHIEEVVMPEETVGKDYFLTLPKYADVLTDEPYVLRLLPLEADTTVTFDPAIEAPQKLAQGKPWQRIVAGKELTNLHVKATKPLVVALYMEGYKGLDKGAMAGIGDPSLSIAIPVEQYRSEYLFTAPITYASNIASIVAKHGSKVTLDGKAIAASEFGAIGKSGYDVAHVRLESESGVHTLSADQKVGLTVYGYGAYTSYMYPGGADLAHITIPTVL